MLFITHIELWSIVNYYFRFHIHKNILYMTPPKVNSWLRHYLSACKENNLPSHLRALVITSWSPSSMVEEKPQSPANLRAQTTAMHSTVLSEEGRANLSDMKVRRSPKWFLITTPTPVSFESWKKAPSLKGLCVLVLSNHAKLCVFYWVLMCLKVVIEDHVKNTKFA